MSQYQYPDQTSRREAAEQRFRLGRIAVKEGRLAEARDLLQRAVEIDREHSDAWLWLSATTNDPLEQKKYLEWALAANPANPEARRGLAILQGRLNPKDLLAPGAEVQPRRPTQPVAAHAARTFVCPQCGGAMVFSPQLVDLKCERCGHVEVVEEKPARDVEQILDLTLPTERGHRWAEAERRLVCQQCSATTIFAVGATSTECPFCGSNVFIAAREDADILMPQAVVPMGLEAEGVRKAMRKWLGAGFFAPDDLTKLARSGALRPAYVPFWLFDATLNGKWHALVAEGSGRYKTWVQRSGEHIFFFSNEPVPGTKQLPADLLTKAEPFEIEKAVEYKPEYLAGWPATAYDVPLAQASLVARERMVGKAKKQLLYKAAPGKEVRDLEVSASDVSGVMYKQVLLPVWVGSYLYRGKRFRMLVNGQTGKVVGDKPIDSVKVALMILGAVILIVVLLFVLVLAFGPQMGIGR
jgi:DNA-directed RNA polymerase subunit RPC12/RpoP